MVKNGFLHCHSMYSLHDSAVTPDELVKRAKEMGAKNITLTDHGTMLGIEPFFDAGKKYGINTIPGVEIYLENREHFILVAKDYTGYQALSHLMRDAAYTEIRKKTYALVPYKALEDMPDKDHLIATSACIQGPISQILLHNLRIQKKIKKLETKIEPFLKDKEEYKKLQAEYKQSMERISALKNDKKNYTKFTKPAWQKKIDKKKEAMSQQSLFQKEEEKEIKEMENSRDLAYRILKNIDSDIKKEEEKKKEIKKKRDASKKGADRSIKADKEISKLKEEIKDTKDVAKEAIEKAAYYKKMFPNFFIELQYHGIPEEKYAMKLLVKIARHLSIPVIAANDAHMADNSEDSVRARQILRFNYFTKHQEVDDADRELYLKSDEELFEALSKVAPDDVAREALDNLSILNSCHVVLPDAKHYPRVKGGLSFDELLEEAKTKKIKEGKWDDVYEERLKHEISVIKQMGYVDYHMVVRDFCNIGRQLGTVPKTDITYIPTDFSRAKEWVEKKGYSTGVGVGPGRGSAAGSLVCYLLGITNIDPIKYGLLFERFLNPERVSMPDIDTDCKTSLRQTIIRYLKWKYGDKAVCSIATETTYGAKGAVQMAGRDRADEIYGNLPNTTKKEKISKYMHAHVYPVSDSLLGNEKLDEQKEAIASFPEGSEERIVWDRARLIEGKLSGTGIHAGGVVISDNDDINDYIPLAWNNEKNVWAAQCDMVRLEEKGLLKMDLLGLNTLDILSDCLQLIEKHHGIRIDLDEIPFEEEVFHEIYAKGDTNSVFQFESGGMKDMLKQFHPDTIEDIILLVAAYRPGPMSFIPDIIAVKKGQKMPDYVIPEMDSVLGKTYGCPIYQEQIMQIFNRFAGFSLGEADIVRRYMSKKKVDKFLAYKDKFIDGLVERGADKAKAEAFWESLVDFSKYAFNKSHAASYAVVSYQTAYLKYHYPAEFLCAMFNNKEQEKFTPMIEDCKTYQIKILPPSLLHSRYDFTVEDGQIRFGFRGIKGVSDQTCAFIDKVTRQKYKGNIKDFKDFYLNTCVEMTKEGKITQMKSSVMEAFINVGVLDCYYDNREELLERYHEAFDKIKTAKSLQEVKNILNSIKKKNLQKDILYNEEKETELLGSIISVDPLADYPTDTAYGCTPIRDLADGSVVFFGFVAGTKRAVSKKGNPLLFLNVQGITGNIEVMLMGDLINKEQRFKNRVVKISGNKQGNWITGRQVSLLAPHLPSFQYINDSMESNELLKNVYQSDQGDKCREAYILNFLSADGVKRTVPMITKILMSEEAAKKLIENSKNAMTT